jgi:glycerol-3-phosphate dehydrogenase (NAD(P)+)
MSDRGPKAAVLGGGSFGTAISTILAQNGYATRLWVRDQETAVVINQEGENPRYLPGAELPSNLKATGSLEEAISEAELVFIAIPSTAFMEVLECAREQVPPGTVVVSCTKGIHADGFLLMSQLLAREWPQVRVGVLSGPNLAREIVEQKFTGSVIASRDKSLCEHVQKSLSCDYFRVYDNVDVFGVELAGALKNIYAIASGMAAAMGVGENSRSFLITRSLAEMSRFAVRLGANPMTFLGLAGVGDLIVTCSSHLSRNFQVGFQLGQGKTLQEAVAALGQTAEGINTVKLVAGKADEMGVYMPIASGLCEILFRGRQLAEIAVQLMQGEHNHDVEFLAGSGPA